MNPSRPPVLLVEDRDSLRSVLRRSIEAEGFDVVDVADGASAVRAIAEDRFLAIVTDLRLPGAGGHEVLQAARQTDPNLPVIVMTAYGTVEDAVRAMKGGAFDFLSKPVEPDHLLHLLRRAVERRSLVTENILLKDELADRLGAPTIIGDSETLAGVTKQIRKVAPTDATTLIEGESGTGKELFARAIHHLSPRKDAPFVAINCAAIPETLLENELFGHERGAYTGADSARAGRLELADGGTLFLDEIGELGAAVQAKLLRVLQERTFERVGGNRAIRVDIRIVVATNRNLREEVAAGRFREDLYFRLAVVTLTAPPLRARRSDVPALAAHFLDRFRRDLNRDGLEFSADALEALENHAWPGNIRELENCVERAAILADGDRIETAQLGLRPPTGGDAADSPDRVGPVSLDGSLDEVGARARDRAETAKIRAALDAAGGNKTAAAEALAVNYKRLLARIKELGIEES